MDCRGIRLEGNEGRGMKKKEWFRARDRNNVKEEKGKRKRERETRRGKSSRDGGETLARINT